MGSGVAYVGEHPVEGKGMKLATAHRDDRAKTTIESTTTRGLDDVDLAAKHSITAQNPGLAVGQPNLTAVKFVSPTDPGYGGSGSLPGMISLKCAHNHDRFRLPAAAREK